MTKAELIEAMKDFPDDMEIRIGIKKDSDTYSIDRAMRFCNESGKADNFITLEPGRYYYEDD